MWCSSIYNKTISGIRGIRQRRNITLVSNIMNGCYAASSSSSSALCESHIFPFKQIIFDTNLCARKIHAKDFCCFNRQKKNQRFQKNKCQTLYLFLFESRLHKNVFEAKTKYVPFYSFAILRLFLNSDICVTDHKEENWRGKGWHFL